MKLIKADNYQTWYIENFDKSILIDPWLTNKLQPEGSLFIQRNKKHKITAIGEKIAIRLAVSRSDVDHVYESENY